MVMRLATSPHDPLGITDSACKNQSVLVSVQYGPFSPYIPIRSTTIGKSRVAIDPIAMHTSWRSNSDIVSITSVGYPRMSASGESSTTMHRLLHASGSHPIPTPYDPKTNQYNQDLGLIHSTNGNHLESLNEGSSIDHQNVGTEQKVVVAAKIHQRNLAATDSQAVHPSEETLWKNVLVGHTDGKDLKIHDTAKSCASLRTVPDYSQLLKTGSTSSKEALNGKNHLPRSSNQNGENHRLEVVKIFEPATTSLLFDNSIYNFKLVSIKRAKQDETSATNLAPNNGENRWQSNGEGFG
ncbi:hypothetical protein F511_25294 [Dorcoceras hygrometricum]|uniref:Uncharacterized protein n=1 Tax=Dorcoceras hygrometricum TaxID=472368 RepID=A0A2Z7D5T8_9LAMI|nr:hypothetical protein F511_25294 [Dorcoceras hygrometricum]